MLFGIAHQPDSSSAPSIPAGKMVVDFSVVKHDNGTLADPLKKSYLSFIKSWEKYGQDTKLNPKGTAIYKSAWEQEDYYLTNREYYYIGSDGCQYELSNIEFNSEYCHGIASNSQVNGQCAGDASNLWRALNANTATLLINSIHRSFRALVTPDPQESKIIQLPNYNIGISLANSLKKMFIKTNKIEAANQLINDNVLYAEDNYITNFFFDDIDSDGKIDLIANIHSWYKGEHNAYEYNKLIVIFGSGNIKYKEYVYKDPSIGINVGEVSPVASYDFNGDGLKDILAECYYFSGEIRFYMIFDVAKFSDLSSDAIIYESYAPDMGVSCFNAQFIPSNATN